MKYKVLGVYKSGPLITGYSIQDSEEDKVLKVKVDDFNELVKAGIVDNFKCLNVENTVYVVPRNGLISQLAEAGRTEYKINDRVFDDNGHVAGYSVTTSNNEQLKISIKKAWELALSDCIINANAAYRDKDGSIQKLMVLDE
jgi:hypothetical protein